MTDFHPDASAQTAVGVLPDHLAHRGDPGKARSDYFDVIRRAITDHPRSQQRELGPSEIGDPCARRIGHKLLGTPARTRPAAWKPTVGTAVHAWLEQQFDLDNLAKLGHLEGQERWLVETRVTAGFAPEVEQLVGTPWLAGSCDLYDRVTATVIDHKVVGPRQLKKYRAQGAGALYRTQAHTYGLGWANRGFPVEAVAICFLPRDGDLSDAHWWSEPWDRQVALDAIERYRAIAATVTTLGTSAPAVLPTADAYCTFCPYYASGVTDLAAACPGDPGSDATRTRPQIHPTNPADPFA